METGLEPCFSTTFARDGFSPYAPSKASLFLKGRRASETAHCAESNWAVRGRKREARRWCDELTTRCAKIFPIADGVRAWVAELQRLKARDPALGEAVSEVCEDDMRRDCAMTYEQWHARFIRRVERQRRERRRRAAGSAPKPAGS